MTAPRFYVYRLIDPRDGAVFYVGKGQRSRGHDHARRHAAHGEGSTHPKDDRIRAIVGSGRDVAVEIVERFAHEADALEFERAEIARIGLGNLTNIMSGYHSAQAEAAREAALTVKQEKFCHNFVETGVASEAYRRSYDTENMLAKTVWEEASRLLANPNVAARIGELRAAHAARHAVTVDSLTTELEEARRLALDTTQPSAAVSASMGKAKLHGLLVDKAELAGKDGGPIETSDRSAADAARRIAFVLARAAARKKRHEE